MQFVTIQEMRSGSRELWAQLKNEGEVILTSNGKPVALLAGVTEKNAEKVFKAFRQAKAIIAVKELQKSAVRSGPNKLTPKQIEAEISAARRRLRR